VKDSQSIISTVELSVDLPRTEHTALSGDIVVGKDVLELLTSAMYTDPLSLYREYVQNASDSIDSAIEQGLLASVSEGSIEIYVDVNQRTIRIRDNGTAIPEERAQRILTAIGASQKRGTDQRGFRGVGRLSGLGYAQNLTFRSKSEDDRKVSEVVWNARILKKILQDSNWSGDLTDLVKDVAKGASIEPLPEDPPRFFEVILENVVRIGRDELLSPAVVSNYLSQVCPVPFDSKNFSFAAQINSFLETHKVDRAYALYLITSVSIGLEDRTQIYRPHRDSIEIKPGLSIQFTDLEFRLIGEEGNPKAVLWQLHHNYLGAIPATKSVSGLRLRSGNVQVGSNTVVADVYTETRFNSWTVAEAHILDKKIIPTGRRDYFEQNLAFLEVIDSLCVFASETSRLCRASSSVRNQELKVDQNIRKADSLVNLLSSGAFVTKKKHQQLKEELIPLIEQLQLTVIDKRKLGKYRRALLSNYVPVNISGISSQKRNSYQEVFSILVDELGVDQSQNLINKVLNRIKSNA
jgi:hypothetical protein